jgi:hypothetical protein
MVCPDSEPERYRREGTGYKRPCLDLSGYNAEIPGTSAPAGICSCISNGNNKNK